MEIDVLPADFVSDGNDHLRFSVSHLQERVLVVARIFGERCRLDIVNRVSVLVTAHQLEHIVNRRKAVFFHSFPVLRNDGSAERKNKLQYVFHHCILGNRESADTGVSVNERERTHTAYHDNGGRLFFGGKGGRAKRKYH